jgi:hypothetical protein
MRQVTSRLNEHSTGTPNEIRAAIARPERAGFTLAACSGHFTPPPTYTVGGAISGLTASSLVLQNSGANNLAVAANASSFRFTERLVQDSAYSVSIETQPTGLTCSVTEGAGVVATANLIVGVQCIPNTFVIAGTVTGLSSSGLTLLDNGTDPLIVAAGSNSFQFQARIARGGGYNIEISAQPADLTCTISHGAGTDITATVTNISISCSTVTHTVGGSIAGLTADGLVLQNNGRDNLDLAARATSFQFATPIAAAGGYAVTVASQPTGLTCSVSNGTGTHLQANVIAVQVTCNVSTFEIGGSVTGLTGSGLVLQDNSADNLSVISAGSFRFATAVAYGGGYAVTVLTQPAGQTCTATNGSGLVNQSVSNVAVACANIPTYIVTPTGGANGSISPNTPQLDNSGGSVTFTATADLGYVVNQWLVNGSVAQSGGSVFTLPNITGNATLGVTFSQTTLTLSVSSLALQTSGSARTLTITNTGSIAASNLAVQYPVFPAGTSGSATCGATLAAAATCVITIVPGANATSDGSNSCTIGTAPLPGTVSVSADDASAIQAQILVLSYGCIYQGGYVYFIDDTTPTTSSMGGAVVEASDAGTFPWSNGTFIITNASSLTDGAANTATIIATQGVGSYAAIQCTQQSIAGYSDWYLPGEDQLAAIYQNANSAVGLSNLYWSSTEHSANPQLTAWGIEFTSGAQLVFVKADTLSVRCVRALE